MFHWIRFQRIWVLSAVCTAKNRLQIWALPFFLKSMLYFNKSWGRQFTSQSRNKILVGAVCPTNGWREES